jgi:hypothetical protein
MPAALAKRVEALEQNTSGSTHTVVVRFVSGDAQRLPAQSVVSGEQRWTAGADEDEAALLRRAQSEVRRTPWGVAVLFAVEG